MLVVQFFFKNEAAKPLFEADSEQQLMHLNTYSTALIEHATLKVEEIELDINHIKAYEIPLAPNTVGDGNGGMFIEWHDDITILSATIDIMHNGDMVQLFLVLNLSDLESLVAGDRAELSLTAHGLLSNDKVSIEIIEDSHITFTTLVAEINEVAVGDTLSMLLSLMKLA